MNRLLRTEWLKIKKYPAFWWMTAIVAVSYPGINYMTYYIYQDVTQRGDPNAKMMLKMLIGNPFTFPEVWHTVAYFSTVFIFIPAIVVIMFITNEYTYKTHRQNIIDGWSRNQFMGAKLIDVLLITLLSTLLYTLVALIIGYVNYSEGSHAIWEQSQYIGLFFLQTFSQLSIAFLIAVLCRRAFIALGVFLFYKIVEKILVGLAAWKAKDIGQYLPFEISNRTIPAPAFFGRLDPERYKTALADVNPHIAYTIILVVLTWVLCFWLNKRRDL